MVFYEMIGSITWDGLGLFFSVVHIASYWLAVNGFYIGPIYIIKYTVFFLFLF